MTYDGGTLAIGMLMMSAIIQEEVVVLVVPCGTYLEYGGK